MFFFYFFPAPGDLGPLPRFIIGLCIISRVNEMLIFLFNHSSFSNFWIKFLNFFIFSENFFIQVYGSS